MYYDLFANLSVNVKVAKMFGLHTAVYWAEIMHIMEKVVTKKTFTEDGMFIVDRSYITSRTTLTAEEQYECDAILSKVEVIMEHPENKDQIGVRMDKMVALITSEDIAAVQKLVKSAKATRAEKSEAKRAGAAAGFKSRLVETDPDVLQALRDWIDSIYANKNYLTSAAIKAFQETVDKFTSDKAIKIQIIRTAMSNGWKDASWAINSYLRNKQMSGTKIMHEQKVGTAVADINF